MLTILKIICGRKKKKKGIIVELSKEKHYFVNGRRGQYELSTADGKHHCFFMDDTNVYEYFPVSSTIKEDASTEQ